jgi:hypothetical protein
MAGAECRVIPFVSDPGDYIAFDLDRVAASV